MGLIGELKEIREIQQLMKNFHKETDKWANYGSKITKNFENWIKNNEKIGNEKKIEFINKCKKINENKEIEKYLIDRLKNSKDTYKEIMKSMNKMGLKIGRGIIINLNSKFNLRNQKVKDYTERKPSGYWKNWENLKHELLPIILEKFNGKFPGDKKLKKAGYSSLASAIVRYHGGFGKVRERLGYKTDRKTIGYWKKWENVETELKKVINNELNGKFPTDTELTQAGHSSLAVALTKYHGGINEVRTRMGYEIETKSPRYWMDWKNVKSELERIIYKEFDGKFPTAQQLTNNGYGGIVQQIYKFHEGLYKVRERLGFPSDTKPPSYWKKWKNIERELKSLIANEFDGIFPSHTILNDSGYYGLSKGIRKYHGGIIKVREQMGYELDNWNERSSYYVKRGHSTENTVKNILQDWADFNGFPYSDKNQTKVAPGRYLEFVCGENKKYGIDITNSKTIYNVERKWKNQKYHKFVDELWVIVVSNKFKDFQYQKWNLESPENVLVIDYKKLESFLNSFSNQNAPFEIPLEKKLKLEALARCTFKNKDKIEEKFRNRKNKKKKNSV